MTIQSLRTSDCINEVIEKYSNMVYRLAYVHAGGKHDAEDVFQNVFLTFIAKPRTFRDEEHLKAWLIRVTINKCKSLKSSAWARKTQPLEDSMEMVSEIKDESGLFEYIALLPQKYRSVIHLFYYEDLSVKQISEVLNARESTVRTWLTRARAILREKLKGDFFDE